MTNITTWKLPWQADIPPEFLVWLTATGSLTRHLQVQALAGFSVTVLGESWREALPDECAILGVAEGEKVYQREVLLCDGNMADVYARTVMPKITFEASMARFTELGAKPLGEMLFTDPEVIRGELKVRCLQQNDWLYQQVLVAGCQTSSILWARRSPFFIGDNVLLVNEIFLPNLVTKNGRN